MISCKFTPPQKINIKCPKCGYVNQFEASATDGKGNWVIDNVHPVTVKIPKKKTKETKTTKEQLKPTINHQEIEKLLEMAVDKITNGNEKEAKNIFNKILSLDPDNMVAVEYLKTLK
jgi:hypothetical protein